MGTTENGLTITRSVTKAVRRKSCVIKCHFVGDETGAKIYMHIRMLSVTRLGYLCQGFVGDAHVCLPTAIKLNQICYRHGACLGEALAETETPEGCGSMYLKKQPGLPCPCRTRNDGSGG